MVKKEFYDSESFNLLQDISFQVYPIAVRRGSNGDWSIDLHIDLGVEITEGKPREIVTGQRIITVRASQRRKKQEIIKKTR